MTYQRYLSLPTRSQSWVSPDPGLVLGLLVLKQTPYPTCWQSTQVIEWKPMTIGNDLLYWSHCCFMPYSRVTHSSDSSQHYGGRKRRQLQSEFHNHPQVAGRPSQIQPERKSARAGLTLTATGVVRGSCVITQLSRADQCIYADKYEYRFTPTFSPHFSQKYALSPSRSSPFTNWSRESCKVAFFTVRFKAKNASSLSYLAIGEKNNSSASKRLFSYSAHLYIPNKENRQGLNQDISNTVRRVCWSKYWDPKGKKSQYFCV